MSEIFDTSKVKTADCVPFWNDVVCSAYAACDFIPGENRQFQGRNEVADLGLATVTKVETEAAAYVRNPQDVRRDGREDVFLKLMLEGEVKFEQNGRSLVQRAGDVMLYDSGRRYRFQYDNPYRAILLRLNRSLVQSRIITLDTLGGTVIDGRSPMGRVAAGVMKNFHELSAHDDPPETVLVPMIDLLFGSFSSGVGIGKEVTPSENDKIGRVKRYLIDNIGNEDLKLDQVAKDQNMSPRTLSRLFSAEGTTPMGWLQTQRLRTAYATLSEGRARSITEVAFDHGFSDLSHFGRVFKKMHGVTPRQVFQAKH